MRKRKDYVQTELGRMLQLYRFRYHITQRTLAKRLGVSPNSVYKWENTICKPSLQYMYSISGLLGEPVEALIAMSQNVYYQKKDEDLSGKVCYNDIRYNVSERNVEM